MTEPAFNLLMLNADAMKRGALAIWTVYDYPDGCIARMHEVDKGGSKPTDHVVTGELEEIRKIFWKAGLMKLTRGEGDEPQIVESWI